MYITLIYLQIDCFQVCCNFGIEDVMFYTMFIAEKAYLVNTKLSRRAGLSLNLAFVFSYKASWSVFFPNQEALKCLVVRIRNPGNFHLWNPDSRALESEIQLKGNGIPLTITIRNPRSTNNESRNQYLESGILKVGSRIQGCLPFTQTTRVELLRLRAFPIFPQG